MRKSPGIFVLAAALTLATAGAQPDGPSGKRIGPFTADPLADGIHLLRPDSGDTGRTNSLVVERDDGVLVVDAQPTPAAARELLQAVAKLTPKPVRFLVLSHPHADAAGGASAFPRDVLVIGSAGCRDALADAAYDFGAEARARARADWTEPERRLPTAVPASELRLHDRRNPVEIYPVLALPAHSSGDLIVWIRGHGIVAVGDLIAPSRAVFTKGSGLVNWSAVLTAILSDKPKMVAPLRGPAVDLQEVRLAREAIAWVRGRVEQEFTDGAPAETIPDRILAAREISRYFPSEVPRATIRAMIEGAIGEAAEWRRKHGFE